MGHESLPRLLLGTDEPVPPVHALGAGPLQVRLRGTRLLAIEAAGHEVWHGAAFLYRDEGWGTPEPVADRTHVEQREGGFTVRIEGHIPARERIALERGTFNGRRRLDADAGEPRQVVRLLQGATARDDGSGRDQGGRMHLHGTSMPSWAGDV